MSLSDQVVMATSIETLIELLKNLPDFGRVSYVVTAKGDEVKTAFDIVDASSLLVSNTLDGKINPDYPQELQPRDRTRASSLLQVNQISKDLRPAQLTDSGLSSHGAPIIGEDNAVESGNGRTMGIIKAYQDGNADRYREYLIEHATEFGIRPEKVESMTAPVLVRRRLTKVDRVQFAKDSNISDLQEMAASEKAFVDADSITPAMMALFNPSESGDLLSRSNDAFIRGFMTQVGATQAAGLVTEDGRPTRQLVDRIQNAIFAKAYKDARLVRMVAEEPDPDMRNVLTALNAAANDFVQMQALSGEAHKQAVTTIVDGIETADSLDKKALAALKDAVDLVRQSKESGQHINDVIAQGDMFSETAPEVKALALFIVANNRSAKRMATAFKLMAQRINDELQHQGQALGDMFGGGDVSLQDILRQVSQELENEGMQGISGGLFESVSGGSYNGVAPYTSLLLHRASGTKDIIHLIRLLSRTDPQDEQLVQVLAHFVRMPVADVKKWCRLFGISNSLLRGLLNHASSLGRDGFDEIAQAIKNGDMPPAIDWFSIRPTRVKAFLSAAHTASPLAEMVQRLSLIFTDHTALGDLTLDEMKEASIQWADQQNEVNSDFLPAFRKAVSKADDARGILKAFKALQSQVNKHVGDIDGVTAEGRDILKEHGITPEFIDEIRTDMQREVVSSLQIVARALADANPKSAAIVNRVIGDIEASEGMGALKLFLSRAFNPNGNILPGIIGEAKKYVSEEELEQLDQLLKRFSYNPQTRWQMNQRRMGSVHEKVLSAMNSAIANSSVSEEKALEWADSFITEEVEEARAGQNGGIDLRKELADIYRLTGGKISTLSKVVHHQGRAYANLNGVVAVNLNDENASALWHELGHHLEYSNPGLLEKARSFLKANVEGDKPSFVNIGGRGKPEWCFRSRLSNIYMAKVYPPASVSNTGKIRQKSPTISKTSATEVFSMALQLYHDKEAAAASLMNGDGLLELLLGVAKELNNAD
ncbi:hypothetical protein [Escherichia coli]|uniref:hypothetical protein n=1 Tax=Escherichia coli TaxID=562 RepID=UPI00108014D7|nr:hypothetical protein [Escherichia coli]EHR9374276.1 hypothetical protein [Escherichia coli]TGH39606.1 hypothetical protein E5S57_21700 [Escherichia coli]